MSIDPNDPVYQAQLKAEMDAHTEQALIELVYVRTANELLGTAMANLDSALTTTQSVINILTGLQQLKNQITVKSKSAFGFDYSLGTISGRVVNDNEDVISIGANGTVVVLTKPAATRLTTVASTGQNRTTLVLNSAGAASRTTQYQATYNWAASNYFGDPIDPFFAFRSPGDPSYVNFVNTLSALRTSLNQQIQNLIAITPASAQDDPNTLLSNLRTVYNELPPTNAAFSTVEKWVLDNYNVHASVGASDAGKIQNNLTFAITAAQSLNDSQKEKVRQFLYIFQEYYQSASAVLTAISQIITKMATKISS